MKKHLSIFFLIIFFSFTENLLSSTNKPSKFILGCNNEISEKNLKTIDNLKIKQIEIDTHNYRKWTVNSVRIITSHSRFTLDKYKKRFNSTITVTYEDETKCSFEGRVRHSGDEKDHIAISGNTIIQSLDVHLTNGNIKGVTKFKLLRPNTRGNLKDEIFLTELLRNLNYLAPRTMKVNSRINEVHSVMIFQEKAAKELLEFNKRREGPILEGDERFFFRRVENLPNNQLSSWSIGVVPLMNESAKHMLAKQVNSKIIYKSEEHEKMSFKSLTRLNLAYLYHSNKFQNGKNNFNYFDYDLDNILLGVFDDKNILKLDIYNLLIQAANAHHALASNNRKFYWNSIENYFEPINYDSNPNIDNELKKDSQFFYRLPVSNHFFEAFEVLENKIKKIDIKKFHNEIIISGADFSYADLRLKFDKILYNLDTIKKNFLDTYKEELVKYNEFKPIDNILSSFNETLNEIDPNVYLVKHNNESNQFQRCKIYLNICQDYSFSKENIASLLEGELILNRYAYQYLGKDLNFDDLINDKKDKKYNKLNFKNSLIFYDDGIDVKKTSNDDTINIYQNIPGSRIHIINGKIENLIINFYGKEMTKNENDKEFPVNYPIDINGLTGCLSLINLEVKNISINARDSNCEDAVNFINVNGSIDEIKISNSFSDGLDVDFSNLEIANVEIDSAQNDCVDFSAGVYKLNILNLRNCGDKALSVGEKSFLILDEIFAENIKTGIASKDSSIVKLKNAEFKNLKTCVSAYNKKQEFSGGFIEMQNMKCENYLKKVEIDSKSKIFERDKEI